MATVTSTFTGSTFNQEAFIRKICSENKDYVCLITWMDCCCDGEHIDEASFYKASSRKKILDVVDELLDDAMFDKPIFDKDKILRGTEWLNDRATCYYEFVNLTDVLRKHIMNKINKKVKEYNKYSESN